MKILLKCVSGATKNLSISKFCLLCAFIVMVLWTGSVVSLMYGTVYNSVSCARFEERVRESLLVAVLLCAVN